MKAIYAIFAVVVFFGAGVLVGSKFPGGHDAGPDAVERIRNVRGTVEKQRENDERTQDRLRLSQSSTAASALAESLADPRVRTELEKKLREVPFAVLKRVYLERQDEAWERQQERYEQPKELSDEELARRADRLFENFRQNSGGNNYYVSRGDLTLRGGKSYPYVELVEYYSSRGAENGSVEKGNELCYGSTLYVRVGDRYAFDGHSNCLSWVAVRAQHPFAVHSNYNSKRLVPLFDTVSVALPGFGSEGDVNSEWYDAGSNQWISVGKLRWDPVSKEEFTSLTKEIQGETDAN